MTTLVRRIAPLAVAAVALLIALPSSALASKGPVTDQLGYCGGADITGLGSSFQDPAEKLWTGKTDVTKGFNASASKLACSGAKKPKVTYAQGAAEKGSGACLKDLGEGGATVKIFAFPGPCGTDEAPSTATKTEMEKNTETPEEAGHEGEGIQSIPVLQGAVAVVVHLPAGCTATSEPRLNKSVTKLNRLSLEAKTVAGIYGGTIKTWKEAVESSKSALDKLSCAVPAEENETIRPVVRLDKSGTTHIFKEFLAQADETSIPMEEFLPIDETSEKKETKPCKVVLPPESKTWAQVGEGCENQRWAAAANVVRPAEGHTGNPGLIETVAGTASSIGYADLAVAREKKVFSVAGEGGGEGQAKFWVPVSNSKPTSKKVEYADPSTNGDQEAEANSNCKKTVYALKVGEKFPPKTTRLDWSKVKGLIVGKTYPICGLTYVLAPRLYWGWLHKNEPLITEEQSKAIATTVSNYLQFVLQQKEGGGGEEMLGRDYEPLPKKVQKIAELGAKEIGSKIA